MLVTVRILIQLLLLVQVKQSSGLKQLRARWRTVSLSVTDRDESDARIDHPMITSKYELFDQFYCPDGYKYRNKQYKVGDNELPLGLQRSAPTEIRESAAENVTELVETFRFVISRKDLERSMISRNGTFAKQPSSDLNFYDDSSGVFLDQSIVDAIAAESEGLLKDGPPVIQLSMDYDDLMNSLSDKEKVYEDKFALINEVDDTTVINAQTDLETLKNNQKQKSLSTIEAMALIDFALRSKTRSWSFVLCDMPFRKQMTDIAFLGSLFAMWVIGVNCAANGVVKLVTKLQSQTSKLVARIRFFGIERSLKDIITPNIAIPYIFLLSMLTLLVRKVYIPWRKRNRFYGIGYPVKDSY